jgi:hypothetical protein
MFSTKKTFFLLFLFSFLSLAAINCPHPQCKRTPPCYTTPRVCTNYPCNCTWRGCQTCERCVGGDQICPPEYCDAACEAEEVGKDIARERDRLAAEAKAAAERAADQAKKLADQAKTAADRAAAEIKAASDRTAAEAKKLADQTKAAADRAAAEAKAASDRATAETKKLADQTKAAADRAAAEAKAASDRTAAETKKLADQTKAAADRAAAEAKATSDRAAAEAKKLADQTKAAADRAAAEVKAASDRAAAETKKAIGNIKGLITNSAQNGKIALNLPKYSLPAPPQNIPSLDLPTNLSNIHNKGLEVFSKTMNAATDALNSTLEMTNKMLKAGPTSGNCLALKFKGDSNLEKVETYQRLIGTQTIPAIAGDHGQMICAISAATGTINVPLSKEDLNKIFDGLIVLHESVIKIPGERKKSITETLGSSEVLNRINKSKQELVNFQKALPDYYKGLTLDQKPVQALLKSLENIVKIIDFYTKVFNPLLNEKQKKQLGSLGTLSTSAIQELSKTLQSAEVRNYLASLGMVSSEIDSLLSLTTEETLESINNFISQIIDFPAIKFAATGSESEREFAKLSIGFNTKIDAAKKLISDIDGATQTINRLGALSESDVKKLHTVIADYFALFTKQPLNETTKKNITDMQKAVTDLNQSLKDLKLGSQYYKNKKSIAEGIQKIAIPKITKDFTNFIITNTTQLFENQLIFIANALQHISVSEDILKILGTETEPFVFDKLTQQQKDLRAKWLATAKKALSSTDHTEEAKNALRKLKTGKSKI